MVRKYEHVAKHRHTVDYTEGRIEWIAPSFDNQNFVYLTTNKETGDMKLRYPRLGLVLPYSKYTRSFFAVSYDGEKLALANEVHDGHSKHIEVIINGKKAYQIPCQYIEGIFWYDNTNLAVIASDPKSQVFEQSFINGQDVSSRMKFTIVKNEDRTSFLKVEENGAFYSIFEDGQRSESSRSSQTSGGAFNFARNTALNDDHKFPSYVQDSDKRLAVTYLGKQGPYFDDILRLPNAGPVLSTSRDRVGYIGIQKNSIGALASHLLKKGTQHIEKAEERLGRTPLVFGFAYALLGNPYWGPLSLLSNSQILYYPVDNHLQWERGYAYASDNFYTPDDEYVVTAHFGSSGQKLVIDQFEGPKFTEVLNARFIPHEHSVSYIARDDRGIYRVVVVKE